jgi:hypothetical protein
MNVSEYVGKKIISISTLEDIDAQNTYIEVKFDNNTNIAFEVSYPQQCCESFGYFEHSDSTPIKDIIGSIFTGLKVSYSSESNDLQQFSSNHEIHSTVFIEILTSKGCKKWTVYTNHNGYYAHSVAFWANYVKPEITENAEGVTNSQFEPLEGIELIRI